MAVFAIGSGWSLLVSIVEPGLLGSHALFYTAAAGAALTGANPWVVGPPDVVFAGPPTMLLPFMPFTFVPELATRLIWVIGDVAVAVWAIRRLGLPAYWLAFPPLFEAILLGHPEVLVLACLVAGPRWAGLALMVKPYVGFPVLAERRWAAIVVAGAVTLATVPFLPWARFVDELPQIGATIARQSVGDSTFGQPVLMAVAALALAALGPRRALWLAVPVLWPSAQPIYKTMTMPVLPPVLAMAWALPIPGLTLTGVVVLAALVLVERRRALPSWLITGIRPASGAFEGQAGPAKLPGRTAPGVPSTTQAGAG